MTIEDLIQFTDFVKGSLGVDCITINIPYEGVLALNDITRKIESPSKTKELKNLDWYLSQGYSVVIFNGVQINYKPDTPNHLFV